MEDCALSLCHLESWRLPKKIKSKKAMSAILPAFTEGIEFPIIERGLALSFQKTKKVRQFFPLWKHVSKEYLNFKR